MVSHSRITLPKHIHLSFVVRLLLGTAPSALSAVLLILAMPPYGIWPLALLGLLPMILAQYRILPSRLSSIASAVTIGGLVGLYIMDAFLQLPGAPWYMKGLPLIFGLIILKVSRRLDWLAVLGRDGRLPCTRHHHSAEGNVIMQRGGCSPSRLL
jgi:hypothetical protein